MQEKRLSKNLHGLSFTLRVPCTFVAGATIGTRTRTCRDVSVMSSWCRTRLIRLWHMSDFHGLAVSTRLRISRINKKESSQSREKERSLRKSRTLYKQEVALAMARGDGLEPPLAESKSAVLTTWTNPSYGGLPFSDKPASKRYTVIYSGLRLPLHPKAL